MNNNYDDIINLEHPTSLKHPRMSMASRAAQFAPFSALTGYKEAVKETERLTEEKIILDEDKKIVINEKLNIINKSILNKPEIIFTYFIKDQTKSGGKYIEKTGIVKKIDLVNEIIILTDKTKISINDLINIEGEIFNNINA